MNEVAAFELSELLGLHTVPPTVLRHWKDEDGSLQLWIESVLNEETTSPTTAGGSGTWTTPGASPASSSSGEPRFGLSAPRELWTRLQEVSDAELEQMLLDYLPERETRALLERRRRLAERIGEYLADATESKLFSLRYALAPLPPGAEAR